MVLWILRRLGRLHMLGPYFNTLLRWGSSVTVQAFSLLTLQSRRVFTNLNVHTILSSPKESPAPCLPSHPSTYGLLPHSLGCRRKFLINFNRCVLQLHLDLFRQAQQTQGVLSIISDIMTSPDVAKESITAPVVQLAPDWKAIRQSDPIGWTIAALICPSWFATCSTWWVHGPIVSVVFLWIRSTGRRHTRVGLRATVRSKASNPAHDTLSHSFRQYLHHGHIKGCYIITPGEPLIGDYLARRPRGNIHRHPPWLRPNDELTLLWLIYTTISRH